MSLKERVQELFHERDVTPYYVARSTRLKQATLSRILRGLTLKPGYSTINEIADFFKVYPTWILTGKGPKYLHTDVVSEPPIPYGDKPYYKPLSQTEKAELTDLIKKLVEISERNSKILEDEAQNCKNLISLINKLTYGSI